MTRRNDNTLIIEVEDKTVCDLCSKKAETRPYGPRGENVCFECGMKDEAAAQRAFHSRLERQ